MPLERPSAETEGSPEAGIMEEEASLRNVGRLKSLIHPAVDPPSRQARWLCSGHQRFIIAISDDCSTAFKLTGP